MESSFLQIDISKTNYEEDENFLKIRLKTDETLHIKYSKLIKQSKYFRDKYNYQEALSSIQAEIDEIADKMKIKDESIKYFIQILQEEKIRIPIEHYRDLFTLSKYFHITKLTKELTNIMQNKIITDLNFSIQMLHDSETTDNEYSTDITIKLENFLITHINECILNAKFGDLQISTIYRILNKSDKKTVNNNSLFDFILESADTRFVLLKFVELHRLETEKIEKIFEFIDKESEETREMILEHMTFNFLYIKEMKNKYDQLLKEMKLSKEEINQTNQELNQTKQKLDQTNQELNQTKQKFDQTNQELNQTKQKFEQTNQELNQTKQKFEQTNQELNQTKQKFEQTNQELNQTKQKLDQTNQELNQTKQKFEQTNQELNQTKQKFEQTNQELNQTKQKLDQTNQELNQTKQKFDQTNQELNQTKQKFDQTNQELNQTKQKFDQTNQELNQTKQKLDQTNQELNQTKQKFEQTNQELNQTKQKFEQTNQELNQTKQKFEQTNQELNQTKQKFEQTNQELNQTKIKFEQTKDDLGKSKQCAQAILVRGYPHGGKRKKLPKRKKNHNSPKLSFDPSSLLSYSIYHEHTVIVTSSGSLMGFGVNYDGRISATLQKTFIDHFTEICIKDGSGRQLDPVSAACCVRGTLYMFRKSDGIGKQLVLCDDDINGGTPVFLDIGNAEPVSLFSGRINSSAISDRGEVIFIDRYSVKNSPNSRIAAVSLPNGENASSVACGDDSVIVLSLNGRVFESPVTGGSSALKFSEVFDLSGQEIVCVSGTNEHFLAVSKEGRVFCRGSNKYGQLGLGEGIESVSSFTEISSLVGYKIRSASAGCFHSLFVTEEGKVLSCGRNWCGELILSSELRNEIVYTPTATTITSDASFCIAGGDVSVIFIGGNPPPNTPNTGIQQDQ